MSAEDMPAMLQLNRLSDIVELKVIVPKMTARQSTNRSGSFTAMAGGVGVRPAAVASGWRAGGH